MTEGLTQMDAIKKAGGWKDADKWKSRGGHKPKAPKWFDVKSTELWQAGFDARLRGEPMPTYDGGR